jgi:hypothetical protein
VASKGYVRPATPDDAKYIATRLRKADRAECEAVIGKPPEAFLPGSVALATACWSIIAPTGDIIGLFGVSPYPGDKNVGAVWMVATDELPKYTRQFLRETRRWVKVMQDHYPILWNIVDTRNTVHVKWIKWCGFTFHGTHLIGPDKIPFLEFSKVR